MIWLVYGLSGLAGLISLLEVALREDLGVRMDFVAYFLIAVSLDWVRRAVTHIEDELRTMRSGQS